ncbi:hypothetical protein Nepgr_021760 [Nepenthes gracilis]|uniref:Uncharacterized protein n=1 Tax=Nepenthes gracilis TaxID=150966 RepID=A0AAD3XXC9_NEPGR|nr:hypothetical protein Nepgr_021760 [Nepenthes gracilis]
MRFQALLVLNFIDPDLFPEPLRNWEVAYSNKCFYEDNSYTENLLFTSEVDDKFSIEPTDINKFQDDQNEANTATTTTTTTTTTTSNIPTIVATTTISTCLSIVSDFQNEIYDDTLSYTDFSPSSFSGLPYLTTSQQDQIDYTRQVPVTIDGFPQFPADAFAPLMALPLPPFLEEDCLYPVPPSLGLNPCAAASCSFMDPSTGSFYPGDLNVAFASESRGLFDRTISAGKELQQKQRDYQSYNPGIFCTDQPPGITNDGCIQELCNESQPTMISEAACSIPSTTETLNLEDSTFKVVKLSTAERKEKIDRYLKKRNERNFSKKIKVLFLSLHVYNCTKLAGYW